MPTKKEDHYNNSKKFVPAIGKEFEIYASRVEIRRLRAQEDLETSRTRNFLARVLAISLLIGFASAAGYSLYEGDIKYVAALWAAVTGTVTLIASFYFRKSRRNRNE